MSEWKEYEPKYPDWIMRLRAKLRVSLGFLIHPYDLDAEKPEQKNKLTLLYNELITDIEKSDVSDNIKEGLDPLPAMVGYLLAAAGGMGLSVILSSLLSPYVQSKLTYPLNKLAVPYRFDPTTITRLWLRGFPSPERAEEWWKDLQDLGWDDERIAAAKELAMILPTPQDLVMWQAREVFEPDAIAKYGLDDEFEKLDLTLFEKVGISEDMARNYWRAHWQHASFTQIIDMRRRGLINDEDVWEWFRLVEIPPYWREPLTALIWEVPTRVDVRRWWDMRTIDEPRLRQIYQALGYHDQDLEDYVTWTKVYVDFPNLMARYSKGWITLEEVRAELIAKGLPEDRVEELIQEKVKKEEQPERTKTERDLAKSDILKGVRVGKLTRPEGLELLQVLRYDEQEANYLLDFWIATEEDTPEQVKQRDLTKTDILAALKKEILTIEQARPALVGLGFTDSEANILILTKLGIVPEEQVTLISASSPQGYFEYKRLTLSYRRSLGEDVKDIPQDLIDAERSLRAATSALVMAREEELEPTKLSHLEAEVDVARARLELARQSSEAQSAE